VQNEVEGDARCGRGFGSARSSSMSGKFGKRASEGIPRERTTVAKKLRWAAAARGTGGERGGWGGDSG
jgi:hypothetical protein